MQVFIYCKITLHVLGVHRTHHQEYIKLQLQSLVQVIATTFFQRGQIWPRWRKVVAQILWPVPEAAVTVLCTPDDGCDGYPKHVESFCSK